MSILYGEFVHYVHLIMTTFTHHEITGSIILFLLTLSNVWRFIVDHQKVLSDVVHYIYVLLKYITANLAQVFLLLYSKCRCSHDCRDTPTAYAACLLLHTIVMLVEADTRQFQKGSVICKAKACAHCSHHWHMYGNWGLVIQLREELTSPMDEI